MIYLLNTNHAVALLNDDPKISDRHFSLVDALTVEDWLAS